jgi:heme A synthase
MQPLHALLGSVAMAVAALFAIGAAVAAWLDRGHRLVRRAGLAVSAVLVIEVLVGAVLYLGGARPAEGLHLLYGLVILAVLPFASSFASEAPPRSYTGALAVGGLVILLLAWRLLSTG